MQARALCFIFPIIASSVGVAAIAGGSKPVEPVRIKPQTVLPGALFEGKRVLVYSIGSCNSCRSKSESSPAKPVRWNIPDVDVDSYVVFGAYRESDLPEIKKGIDDRFTMFADPYEEAAYALGLQVGEFAVVEAGVVTKVAVR